MSRNGAKTPLEFITIFRYYLKLLSWFLRHLSDISKMPNKLILIIFFRNHGIID